MKRTIILDLDDAPYPLDLGLRILTRKNGNFTEYVLQSDKGEIVCVDGEECEIHFSNQDVVVLYSVETQKGFCISQRNFRQIGA